MLKLGKEKQQAKNIGIDLGTANMLVYLEGVGIIFNEPSVIAFDYYTHEVIAIGHKAANMIGRGHQGIKIISPLNQGVISDMESAKKMIEHALLKVENINLEASTVLICCPSEVTQLERDSLIGLAQKLGVRDIFIEEEVKAGGIGAGLDVYSSNGSMVLDIGGGSTDIGVLSLGDIVVSESIRTAGNFFDNAIMNYMQYEHGLLIGKMTAERIKIEIGSLNEDEVILNEKTTTASGRDVVTGLPKKITITESEIRNVLIPPFETISNTILKVLQITPAELSADIIQNGIAINGGGALINGIENFLHKRIDLNFYISKNPLTAIVEGTKLLLKNRGSYFVKPTE